MRRAGATESSVALAEAEDDHHAPRPANARTAPPPHAHVVEGGMMFERRLIIGS